MKKVAVLGRGASLLEYAKHYTEFDTLYIVNDFMQEIEMLGLHKFLGKHITHVVGRTPQNSMHRQYYEKLGIDTIQANCLLMKNFIHEKEFAIKVLPLPKCMEGRGYPTLPWDVIHEAISCEAFFEHDEMIDILQHQHRKQICGIRRELVPIRAWPTTGLLAIDLALTENALDEIHLFGFDFYEKDYLVKKKAAYQNSEWVKVKMMKYHLKHLEEEYKNVRFFRSKTK